MIERGHNMVSEKLLRMRLSTRKYQDNIQDSLESRIDYHIEKYPLSRWTNVHFKELQIRGSFL